MHYGASFEGPPKFRRLLCQSRGTKGLYLVYGIILSNNSSYAKKIYNWFFFQYVNFGHKLAYLSTSYNTLTARDGC